MSDKILVVDYEKEIANLTATLISSEKDCKLSAADVADCSLSISNELL